MDAGQLLYNLFFDYTLRTVALGAAVLGITSGILGAYAVLRKQSLLGDAMSHAALPGIVLAFLLTGNKDPLTLMLGAIAAGWLATLWLLQIVNHTRISYDSALGFVLSVFFGFGLMLLTFVQRRPDASQAGLDRFLFGQAAALLERDVILMAVMGGAALLVVVLLWKEFKLLSFDPEYSAAVGLPVRTLDVVLTTLLVAAIVIGLQSVGVVLMSAMVVAPAAAARQWTDRLGIMLLLAAFFGALAGVGGAVISSSAERLSTGPMIVLFISTLTLLSFLFAPNRGLVWAWVRRQANRRRLQVDTVLGELYALAGQHADLQHPHSIQTLRATHSAVSGSSGGVGRSLHELERRGLASETRPGEWALTPEGVHEARRRADHQPPETQPDNILRNQAESSAGGLQ